MKAKIKGNLPDAPKPTKAVRIDCNPHNAYFPEAVAWQKEKERRAKEIQTQSWKKEFKSRKPRTWTDEDMLKAVDLAEQGHSFSYIADALGVTRRSVEEHLGTENGGIPEE